MLLVIGLARWRLYAIYRLEHWGLQYVNNTEITDDDIMEANRTYGSLGELAIMVLPQSQILPLIRKFELGKYCFVYYNYNRYTRFLYHGRNTLYEFSNHKYRFTWSNGDQRYWKCKCDKRNTRRRHNGFH